MNESVRRQGGPRVYDVCDPHWLGSTWVLELEVNPVGSSDLLRLKELRFGFGTNFPIVTHLSHCCNI